ncbi:MAG: hypothetical protein Q8Q33_10020 [Chlamydiota bacterium]|nr:hypothetical protein [Chlamydiota bacterium]
MKCYTHPKLAFVMLDFNTLKTQSGPPTDDSSTVVLGNPNNDCLAFDCRNQVGGGGRYDLVVSWNDNAGSDLNGYTVVVDAEGFAINLTNATNGCDITENPAGTYTLQCTDLVVPNGDCCNPSIFTVEVQSITDPDNNTLNVSNESCEDSAVCL